LHKQTAATFHW